MSRVARMTLAAALVGATGLASAVLAQGKLTGEKILRRAESDHRAKDEKGVVDMVLVSRSKKKNRRTMETYYKQGEGDDDRNLLRFLSPPTVRGTALLTREATGRSDDQWVYLPAFKKAKKIASSGRTNRFAGTDFTFEDLRTEDYTAHTYERLKDQTIKVGGEEFACFVVQAKPKEVGLSGYSKREVFVEKKRFLVMLVKYYDRKKRHQKTLTSRGFEKVDGKWRAKRSRMQDHIQRSQTLWQFSERKINPGLADSLFTKKNLERGL